MKNRRVVISRPGGLEVLELVEGEMPEPNAGEVRVRVRAAGVSFADALMRAGVYPRWRYVPPIPFAPGWDVVGRIDRCGANVDADLIGQRVVALSKVGGYTDALCVPATGVVSVPDGVDDAAAVSLVLNYVTAYQMLHRVAAVRPGELLLVDGAAGGVGSAIIELGRLADAQVVGTASAEKHDFVRALGATAIDYRNEDVPTALHRLFGRGVDAAFDGIGGWHLMRTLRATRPRGRVVGYGMSTFMRGAKRRPFGRTLGYAGFGAALTAGPLQRKRVLSYSIATMQDEHPAWFRDDLTALLELLRRELIHPTIAARVPLEHARDAHEMLANASVRGRIVLLCRDGLAPVGA